MENSDKSREQLLQEIEELKAKVTKLEEIEIRHKITEEKMQCSEDRYRLLFNLLPYGGEVIDIKGLIQGF